MRCPHSITIDFHTVIFMGIGSGVIINEFCDLHIIIVAAVQLCVRIMCIFFITEMFLLLNEIEVKYDGRNR